MEKALKKAIRQGGIKELPYKEQILVARALLIIRAIPEECVGEELENGLAQGE